jgi:hypothetical protein
MDKTQNNQSSTDKQETTFLTLILKHWRNKQIHIFITDALNQEIGRLNFALTILS